MRLDIQGLRAFAVLSVIIYHVAPLRLPGGFIGVDIFFCNLRILNYIKHSKEYRRKEVFISKLLQQTIISLASVTLSLRSLQLFYYITPYSPQNMIPLPKVQRPLSHTHQTSGSTIKPVTSTLSC